MKELYNFNSRTHYIYNHLGETAADAEILGNLQKTLSNVSPLNKEANIIYNKQKTDILAWGEKYYKSSGAEESDIIYDNFRNRLYHLFKKNKHTWDDDDIFFTKAVSQFLKLLIEEAVKNWLKKDYIGYSKYLESLEFLNYVFIVPSEWEVAIREDLIRPIFIEANLISKNDHNDRLLFVSDLESICYYLQRTDSYFPFEKEQNTIIFRCNPIDEKAVLIKIDLIETKNTLFNIPDSMLFPKIMYSYSFAITSTDFKHGIKTHLKNNLFFVNEDTGQNTSMRLVGEDAGKNTNTKKLADGNAELNINMVKLVDDIYEYIMRGRYKDRRPIDLKPWKLTESQMIFLDSIHPFHICSVVDKKIYNMIKSISSKNLLKQYKFFATTNYPVFKGNIEQILHEWVVDMLHYNLQSLKNVVSLCMGSNEQYQPSLKLDSNDLIFGISEFMIQTIQNSNMYSMPCVVPNKNQTTSSTVKYLKPGAIICIDISLESTLISYSALNEDGLSVEIFDNDYFTDYNCLPSLKNFYNINSKTTLKTKRQFISLAENYLSNGSKSLGADENLLFRIKNILSEEQFGNDTEVSIPQQKYIEAFLLMYFVYIEKIISSKLRTHEPKVVANVGYAISIEKFLLDVLIGSKENFGKLLYTSGLISRNDSTKKLRIITKGEEILSLIQPLLKLEFPVRSYFVLAQLHENYIQLTLYQVVTASTLEDKQQEAIIFEDRIISTQNIYDSLCLNMWNNLLQDSCLIQSCDIHSKGKITELFSLANKTEFTTSFKKYISKNILAPDSDLRKLDKIFIKMSSTCNCRIKLTINDVVEISFKPLLTDMTSICMASLVNKNIFGNYYNIDYHFSLIHFNHNLQFLEIIIDILREECENFNPWQGIDTKCIVIPKLSTQFFQPVLNSQSYLYKGFVIGTLHQIYTENYALHIYCKGRMLYEKATDYKENENEDDTNPITIYTSNEIGKDNVGIRNNRYISLFKEGDIMSNFEIIKSFYLEQIRTKYFQLHVEPVFFDLYTYKTCDAVNCDGSIAIKDKTWSRLSSGRLQFTGPHEKDFLLPVIITIQPPGYSSAPLISFKRAGENTYDRNIVKRAYTMTLSRF